MVYSHRKSGQPGPITRIMCCTKQEYDRLPAADRDLVGGCWVGSAGGGSGGAVVLLWAATLRTQRLRLQRSTERLCRGARRRLRAGAHARGALLHAPPAQRRHVLWWAIAGAGVHCARCSVQPVAAGPAAGLAAGLGTPTGLAVPGPSHPTHPRCTCCLPAAPTQAAYNKPVAIIDWLANNDVKEDYVLVIDADMVMREPFTPEVRACGARCWRSLRCWHGRCAAGGQAPGRSDLASPLSRWPQEVGAKPGWAVAAYFGYMKGVKNALAMKHVPWVLPRNDTLAGAGVGVGAGAAPCVGCGCAVQRSATRATCSRRAIPARRGAQALPAQPASTRTHSLAHLLQARAGGVATRWAGSR